MSPARALRTLMKRRDVDAEVDAELQSHIELETEDLIRSGLTPAEARRRAMIAFGGVQKIKEDAIEDATPPWIEGLRRDSRIAFRSLVRHRAFSIAAIVALSLAIAVNTTMFSVIDGMLHPSAGAREPDRIYEIVYYGDIRKRLSPNAREHVTTSVIGGGERYTEWQFGQMTTVASASSSYRAAIVKVRPNFFSMLGVQPAGGRLTPGADNASAGASVVLSTRVAALLFAKGVSPVGKPVTLNGTAYTVIGVVPRMDAASALGYDAWSFSRPDETLSYKYLRLPDDETIEQVRQRFAVLAAQLAITAGEDAKQTRFYLKPVRMQFSADAFHYALIGAGLAILIVACTNLANLQLARGLTRSAELAVRSSLGASRRQIVTQLLFESGALAVVAFAVSLILATAGSELVRAYVPEQVGPYIVEPKSSWRVIPVALMCATICLFAVGLFPALTISRTNLNELLKGRAGTGAHRRNRRTYSALVITQIALTLPLTCAAVLLSVSAWRMGDFDFLMHRYFGFDPRPIVSATFSIPRDSLHPVISLGVKAESLTARARAVPGVVAAAVTDTRRIADDRVTAEASDGTMHEVEAPLAFYHIVTPGYFKTYGYRISAGRTFQDTDVGTGAVIIDDLTRERLWPQSDPVGRLIRLGSARSNAPAQRVIGVFTPDLDDEAREMQRAMLPKGIGSVYRVMSVRDSLPLTANRPMQMVVRFAGDGPTGAERLRRALTDDPRHPPVVETELGKAGFEEHVVSIRFMAGLFVVFGAIGLGLSLLGVYAIASQSVTDRRREVAVRIALGASARKIIYALLREGNVLMLAGIAIGLYLTKETMELLNMFLGTVELTNAPLYAVLCVALFGAMFLAALIPAVRATRMDPMEVLRAE